MSSSSTPKRAVISGTSGSINPSPIFSICRMKSSRRLANALNAQLVAAEARRAEQGPTPDSMDLYFQGLAWLNKRPTAPEFVIFIAGLSFEALRTRYNLLKSPDLHF